jgi:hypothetical protein
MTAFKCILAALVLATAAATDPVLLGSAEDFVILSKAGVSTVPASAITGNIGVSPGAASYITGFDLIADSTNTFSTSTQITGQAYASDYSPPTPSAMTSAISAMEAAYTDATGRPLSDGANRDIKSGLITGETFTAGVYTWGSDVMFNSEISLKGSSSDIFIFQTTNNVVAGRDSKVTLVNDGTGNGAPKASNIFWQVAGFVEAGEGSHLEGVFLVKTRAVFKTGSSLNGRILTQTACTLDAATVKQPPVSGR